MRAALLAELLVGGPALAGPVTATDGNGREVTLDAPPERIVCLLNCCAEELAFVGGPVPVGFGAPYTWNVANDPVNFGDAAEGAARIDQTDGVDFKAIAVLDPDLVIGELEHVEALAGIAPLSSLSCDPQEDVDAFLADVRSYARLMGREEGTEAGTAAVLDRAPDVLVIENWDEGVTLEGLAALPLWSELRAVREGRVHLLPPNRTLDYSLLAADLSLDALVPLLEPDAFPAPLTDDQVAAALAE